MFYTYAYRRHGLEQRSPSTVSPFGQWVGKLQIMLVLWLSLEAEMLMIAFADLQDIQSAFRR
jgi:hypothetical protein